MHEQEGAVQCEKCMRWFCSRSGLMVHRYKKRRGGGGGRWYCWRCRGFLQTSGVQGVWQNLQQTRRSQETQMP